MFTALRKFPALAERAGLVSCAAGAWLVALTHGCTPAADPQALSLRVSFLCEADRAASDRLRLVIRRGNCAGTSVYEELLERGEEPGAVPSLTAGVYGFEASALADGAVLASACKLQQLPASQDRLSLTLASDSCGAAGSDASVATPLGSDAGALEPGVTPPIGVGADAGATPVSSDPPPVGAVDAGGQGECGAGCGTCAAGCPGGTHCEDDVCKPDAASDCSAARYAGHAYLFCSDTLTWNAARSRCRNWGFGLVRIDDASENAFVQQRLAGRDAWLGASDLGPSDVGAAGIDVQLQGSFGTDTPSCRKVDGDVGEGHWYWASERANVSNDTRFCELDTSAGVCAPSDARYVNFNAGEPDNANCACAAVCLPGEDCGLMLADSGAWSDRGCLALNAFVCEASP